MEHILDGSSDYDSYVWWSELGNLIKAIVYIDSNVRFNVLQRETRSELPSNTSTLERRNYFWNLCAYVHNLLIL